MLEELTHESITEERLDALNRELDDIMGNLTGPTVDVGCWCQAFVLTYWHKFFGGKQLRVLKSFPVR
jgi:hypothetical protein